MAERERTVVQVHIYIHADGKTNWTRAHLFRLPTHPALTFIIYSCSDEAVNKICCWTLVFHPPSIINAAGVRCTRHGIKYAHLKLTFEVDWTRDRGKLEFVMCSRGPEADREYTRKQESIILAVYCSNWAVDTYWFDRQSMWNRNKKKVSQPPVLRADCCILPALWRKSLQVISIKSKYHLISALQL